MKQLILGTRGSKLALTQARSVASSLEKKHNNIRVKLKKIKTTGDKIKDTPLYNKGGKGLFIKEIEKALIDGKIDLAVHSLKDVPGKIGDRFSLTAFPRREAPEDVLIAKNNCQLQDLPEGAKIGTGSLRRQNQLKKYRPDFEFINIRGNIDTRIKKLKERDLDGIILAAAGLHRIGREDIITEYITRDICIPAVGQGTLGIEILKKNKELKKILSILNHKNTELQSLAERTFLKTLNGNCKLPLGGYLNLIYTETKIRAEMKGFLSDINGNKYLVKTINRKMNRDSSYCELKMKIEKLGKEIAELILKSGGKEIIKKIKENAIERD
ncbi:MAG: hydroxymethylbilane synthase [Bacillota bacterium]